MRFLRCALVLVVMACAVSCTTWFAGGPWPTEPAQDEPVEIHTPMTLYRTH